MKTYAYVAALIALLAALAGGGWYIHTNAINKQRIELVEERNKALIRASDATISLQTNKDKALEELQRKLSASDARAKRLARELQNRPARSTPNPPSPPGTCTGAGLYREDGEFLAREAANTERLRQERDYYYERYEDARKQIERLKNGKD